MCSPETGPTNLKASGAPTLGEAYELHWLTSGKYSLALIVFLTVLLVVIFAMVNLTTERAPHVSLWGLLADEGGVVVMAWAMYFALCVGLPRWQIRRQHKCPSGPFQRVDVAITDDTIHLKSDGGESTVKWHALENYKMSGNVILIASESMGLFVLTRSMFRSSADWEELRKMVLTKLRPMKLIGMGPSLH